MIPRERNATNDLKIVELVDAAKESSSTGTIICFKDLTSGVADKLHSKLGKRFFMKSWLNDSPRDCSNYGDFLQELEVLKLGASSKHVVHLIASAVTPTKVQIVLELLPSTMQDEYFFSGLAEERLIGSNNVGCAEHKAFLRHFAQFIKSVLAFLHTDIKRIYCDWKFDNILCDKRPRTTQDLAAEQWNHVPVLKLADFGSVQKIGQEIANPRNCNQLYTPHTLCASLPTILPLVTDDLVSVSYLTYKLNGFRLPWEDVISCISDNILPIHYYIIAALKTDFFALHIDKCFFWPDYLGGKNSN